MGNIREIEGEDGVRRLNFSGKVIKEGFPVGKRDRRDPEGACILHVIYMLQVVVGDEVDQGFKRITRAVLGAVCSLDCSRKGVIGAESVLVINPHDLVEDVPNCVLPEKRQRVHHRIDGSIQRRQRNVD